MTRFALIVCVSLIVGTAAKPYGPWNKIPDEAFQDTVMSVDEEGKMFRMVEVEPPENKADAPYNIDPSMKIWKSMTGLDKDELYQPIVVDMFKGQVQSLDSLPVDNIQAEPLSKDTRLYLEPEEDRDHVNHPAFINIAPEQTEQDWHGVYHKARHQLDPLIAEAEPRVAYSEPETDKDDLYHRDDQLYLQPAPPVPMEPLRGEARRHLHPEEDKDALHHRDVPELIPRQDEPKADGVFFSASQRKYSEPEEDRDGLYHQ